MPARFSIRLISDTKKMDGQLQGRAMLKDIIYAIRALRHKPGFAVTAILSIALAIGANSAIFSLQEALLLRPLPIEKPSNVVSITSRTCGSSTSSSAERA